MVAQFADMNLGQQIQYAPPPPLVQMLPINSIQPQPVVPIPAPQHPSHLSPHQHHHPPPPPPSHKQHPSPMVVATYHLWVPQERVGAVIGGHGAVIRSLQERSGATIQVHNDTVRGDLKLFTISGTLAQYETARNLINEIVDKPRQSHHSSSHSSHHADRVPYTSNSESSRQDDTWSKVVFVPSTCVGLVIGRNGETIRNLQDRSNAEIKVTPDEKANLDSDRRSIEITGRGDAINFAHQLISEIVMDARSRRAPHGPLPGSFYNGQPVLQEVLTIPNEKVGLIIGKRGAAIRELQGKSGAKIQVTKDDSAIQSDGSRPVHITGTRAQVDEAKAMIASKINIPLLSSAVPLGTMFNASMPGPHHGPPVTGQSPHVPYMVHSFVEPSFQNGQPPFSQVFDPNDPAVSNRPVAYIPYMGYGNFPMPHHRQFQSQLPMHFPHPSHQVQQEQVHSGMQTPHQESQDGTGQQSQFASPVVPPGQPPLEALQSSPNMLPRDANGNVMVYQSHYPPLAPHMGSHPVYSAAQNNRILSRPDHVQAMQHAQMLMQVQQAQAAQAHAQAVQAQVQAQAVPNAEVGVEENIQSQNQTGGQQGRQEENEQPNG